MSVTKTIEKDAAGRQIHRLRCAFTSTGAATVVEVEVDTHLPRAFVLDGVHTYGVSGSCTTYRTDIHEAVAGESSVPAGSAMWYQVSAATAKATQTYDARIGAVQVLPSGRSVYVRLVPDSGSDNAGTVDLIVVPTVGV